jgi:hypothetical protein
MKLYKKTLNCILFLLLIFNINKSHSFIISSEPPDKASQILFGATGWSIFIDGDIDINSAKKLEKELTKYYKTGVFIYFNSNGGDPIAAMEIGRTIRRFTGAHVNIGKKNYLSNKIEAGVCLSACTLAYLGGTYRFIDKDSIYGVHLAKLKNILYAKKYDFALGQILSSKIAIYLDEMGVSQDLMKYITSTSEINIIPIEKLRQLLVINEGKFISTWEIKQTEDSQFYLVGEQTSDRGLGKFIFSCLKNKLSFVTAYKYGDTFKSLKDGQFLVHSLYIDNQTYYLNLPNLSDVENSMLFNEFSNFDKNIAKQIALSKSITYQMQQSKESPLFVGFEINIPDKDRSKITTFINGCN